MQDLPLGEEVKPLRTLIGKLQKAVSEECFYFTQVRCGY